MGPEEKTYGKKSSYLRFVDYVHSCIDGPVTWFRETIVKPNQKDYYWYHEKIRRVPTVDECLLTDMACIYEANQQYLLDKAVDRNIVEILRKRYEYCCFENEHEQERYCKGAFDYWWNASTNYFIKYGDLGYKDNAVNCLMKQKHRMAWERRHGPVGTGKRQPDDPIKKKKDEKCEQ